MLVANTFRMGGHATHDEREARATFPAEWFARWGQRDPIGLFEEYLKAGNGERGRGNEKTLREIESAVEDEIANAETEALASREKSVPEGASALKGVYADGGRAVGRSGGR